MTDPITLIAAWLRELLTSWGLALGLVNFIMALLAVVVIASVMLVLDVLLVWVERKVVARFQDRLGPNRLGPFGLIQPFADIIKLLIKEDITPAGADRVVYNIAPLLALASVLLLWAVIPYSATMYGADLDVGVLFIVAAGAIGTLGTIMAGWASNNKYALLGAFRSVAQVIAYEVPMVVILLVPVMLARSMSLVDIVNQQEGYWFILIAPLATVVFLITAIAELGRSPFDLNEAESEIVAGFHIEYTGMKFGLFYAGELLHAMTMGALLATFFLGGWRGPFVDQVPFLGAFYLLGKAIFIYWVIMWVKYSVPRVRIDHMLDFNWKFLVPLALVIVLVTAFTDKLLNSPDMVAVTLSRLGIFVTVGWQTSAVYVVGMLLANVLVAWLTLSLLRKYAHLERRRVGEPRPVATPELAKVSNP